MCSKKTIGGARGQMEGQRDSTRSKGTIEGTSYNTRSKGTIRRAIRRYE